MKLYVWQTHAEEIMVLARSLPEARKLAGYDIAKHTDPIVICGPCTVGPLCFTCRKHPCKCDPIPFG